jgi:hypothetical protein
MFILCPELEQIVLAKGRLEIRDDKGKTRAVCKDCDKHLGVRTPHGGDGVGIVGFGADKVLLGTQEPWGKAKWSALLAQGKLAAVALRTPEDLMPTGGRQARAKFAIEAVLKGLPALRQPAGEAGECQWKDLLIHKKKEPRDYQVGVYI